MVALQTLTSVKNPQVHAARQLATRKGRQAQDAFLCEGEHMVQEALGACSQAVQCLFVQENRAPAYAGLLALAAEASGDVPTLYSVPEHVMAHLTQVKTPQGIAAVVKAPPLASLASLEGRLLLLEDVQDPGNVGTMIRTLDAAGFSGCILAGDCADPFSPKALRASMGSIFRVALAREAQAGDCLRALGKRGYVRIAAALEGDPFYRRQASPAQLVLMIGNEGAGLSRAALQEVDFCYALPMAGGAESLNAAIAAAIMMYDLVNR